MNELKIKVEDLIKVFPKSGELTLEQAVNHMLSLLDKPELTVGLSKLLLSPLAGSNGNGKRPVETAKKEKKISEKPKRSRKDKATDLKRDLHQFLQMRPNVPASISEITAGMIVSGWTVNQIRKAIREAKSDGTVVQSGTKRGATYSLDSENLDLDFS
jgi:hypothetical protein